MELPESKGTYVLLMVASQLSRLKMGRLGAFDSVPGYYAYVG